MPNKTEAIFYHAGLKCVVVLTSMGHRCGYVAVTKPSQLYGMNYIGDWDGGFSLDMEVEVHGGLTYSREAHHTTYPTDQFDPVWYFGFDCAHAWDSPDTAALKQFSPGADLRYIYDFGEGAIRTKEYVADECRRLAEQLVVIDNELAVDAAHFDNMMFDLKEMNN